MQSSESPVSEGTISGARKVLPTLDMGPGEKSQLPGKAKLSNGRSEETLSERKALGMELDYESTKPRTRMVEDLPVGR